MSQLNFGERYFTTRERIAQLVADIHTLAKDTSTDISGTLSESAFRQDLANPFLFVVCGEVNSGKSTLINALFGQELCEVSTLPETDRILWYKHGPSPRDLPATNSSDERYRPIEFLRDFNLVDTPGTNSIAKGHQEILERILPNADLMFFVFPVSNPWEANTWNLISQIPKDCYDRIVFVIQQVDQREETDVEIILQHMADLSMKRIGIIPKTFAVSGKIALEAKLKGTIECKHYRKSGFLELEQFISGCLYNSPERRSSLQAWRTKASISLTQIEDQIDDHTRVLGEQNIFLASLETEIDTMRESLVNRLPDHLEQVAETFKSEAIWVSNALRKKLSLPRSIFRIFMGDRVATQTERLFMNQLQNAVQTIAQSDGKDIVTACKTHWETLALRIKNEIETEIDATEPVTEKLEQARTRFVQRIRLAAQNAIGNLHLRKDLERKLRRRNLALKSFTATTFIFLIVGALCGISELRWAPGLLCGIAALFFAAGSAIAVITKREIFTNFQSSLLDTCGLFAETLRTDYEEALRIFFQDYTTCLNSIRKHLANEKMAVEPKLARWHQLFITLKSIEQDIETLKP